MASFSQLKDGIVQTLRHDPTAVFHIEGSPGTAKTSLCMEVGNELGIPPERIFVRNSSRMEPTDLTGLPQVVNGVTMWTRSELVDDIKEGTGPSLTVFDDAAQAASAVFNPISSLVLDRRVDRTKVDPQAMFISTGNRAKDKAGSKTLPTHYSNRVCTVGMDFSIDDWTGWALGNNVPAEAVAFARLRPALLNDFDPNRSINPTPRSWTHLWTKVPMHLPNSIYLSMAEGYVGEGPAAEWVAAKDMMSKMPSVDYIIMQPTQAEVPAEPAVRYAVATALAIRTTPDNFDRAMAYMERMPKEFLMLYVSDVVRMSPKVTATKTFIDFAIRNKDIFMSSN